MAKQATQRRDIRFCVVGAPPVKQSSIGTHRLNSRRRTLLKAEALRIAERKPYALYGDTKVRLGIVYARRNGRCDAANIVGGIADALQGLFYENDRQLVAISYREETKDRGRESYLITLKAVV